MERRKVTTTKANALAISGNKRSLDLSSVALLVPDTQDRAYVVSWLLQFPERTTRKSYLRHVREFLGRFPGIPLKSFTVAHVTMFLEERNHLSVSSRNLARNSVSSLFAFCVRSGYLDRNPAVAVRTQPAANRFASHVLSEDQMHRLIDCARPGRDQVILLLLYIAGLRVSELCSLTWQSFHQLKDGGARLVVVGKGNKSRSIKIPEWLWIKIQSLVEDRPLNLSERVFLSQMSDRITTARVWQIVRDAAIRAKIDRPVSPHWFRHGHASHSLSNGAALRTLQLTLGHASLATTAKYLDAFPAESSGEFLSIKHV